MVKWNDFLNMMEFFDYIIVALFIIILLYALRKSLRIFCFIELSCLWFVFCWEIIKLIGIFYRGQQSMETMEIFAHSTLYVLLGLSLAAGTLLIVKTALHFLFKSPKTDCHPEAS